MNKKLEHNKGRKKLVFLLLIIISIIIIGMGSKNNTIHSALSVSIRAVTVPFVYTYHFIGKSISTVVESVTELNQLRKALSIAEEEIREYREKFHLNKDCEIEKMALERYLGFVERMKSYDIVGSEIVSWGIKSYFDSIIINKGKLDGIERGMPVIAYQDNQMGLVGKIIEVGLGYSKILPIYLRSSEVGAVLEKDRFVGIISGMGEKDKLELSYIDKRSNMQPGDRVLTLGEGGTYPKGILIGYIDSVYPIKNDFYQTATVKPFIEINRLHEVFIIKKLPNREIYNFIQN